MFFWIGILLLFILPSVADPFISIFKGSEFSIWFQENIETLVWAQIITFISLLFFYLLHEAFPIASHVEIKFQETKRVELIFPIILIALTLVPIIQLIQSFGPLFFLNFGFTDRREGLTYLGQFLLSYNVVCATGFAYWAYSQNRKSIAYLSIGYYLIVFAFLGGSRQPIVAVFLPFLANYIFTTRRKFLKLGVLILSVQIVLTLLAALLVLRNQSSIDARLDLFFNPIEFFNAINDRPSDTAIRFAFYYYIETFSKAAEFGDFSYLLRTLLFWLPSPVDIFNIKPDDFEYAMFQHYVPMHEGTMHPTYFGSIFADAGYFFPAWIPLTHLFHFLSARYLNRQKSHLFYVLIWTVLGLSGIMMARGSLYAPVVMTFFAFIYFGFAKYVSNIK
ncbi:hypothetical protein [Variovorax sp. dw_308]|uniref:hypothetical protein n=1 Tax=Variovorax sp. dw_308 TaxID=2721546 RepID=UPI001C485580|nr:hypothetical protein [Variovorax sp. dw_308]